MLDDAEARDAIRSIGVANLVVRTAVGFDATVAPLLLVDGFNGEPDRLIGHVAKANSIWQVEGSSLALFNGVDGYVSPSWYPSKAEHGRVVPTWNYVAVHVHGVLTAVHDAERKHHIVEMLTNEHERRIGSDWQIDDAPADFIDAMLKAIVGIEVTVERIEGKAKLSQNRPAADIAGVIGANSNPLGAAMRATNSTA
jgi:transcriptional regulator